VKSCSKFIFSVLPAFLFFAGVKAGVPHIDTVRTRQKAAEALTFCIAHGYNTSYCILIDMSLPSGVERFMVWDFSKNNILVSGLVSHGCGKSPHEGVLSKDKPVFSNLENSRCTSPGKYKIGDRAYSYWGIHVRYYLKGLESTNSNAMARHVVLHSWERVPEHEVYPDGTPEGRGCPAVSNKTMKILDALISKQKTHMLLWIYD